MGDGFTGWYIMDKLSYAVEDTPCIKGYKHHIKNTRQQNKNVPQWKNFGIIIIITIIIKT